MAAVALNPGYKVLALKLQEVALMHGDVQKSLSDAIGDHHRASGEYGYYIDHDGDGSEGSVVYCCNGDIRQAPYEISSVAGKAPTASIDFEASKNVLPVTQYLPEPEDEDYYTSVGEAFRASGLYDALPVYERFISKKTRDAADSSSFAGKGRSFPILKPADVSAALHSIGRAGSDNYSSDTIRANIKRIAKAKGFALPDSLKDDEDKKESLVIEFRLAGFGDVELKEAAEFPAKLIAPGRGSSGYYSPDLLKRDGPGVFTKGTQMFWNHATDTEESERPEGDLNNLAGVLTADAKYDENGKDGPGLYAPVKVFGKYVDKVREMGKHIGLSIRAGGSRDEAATGPDGRRGVITQLSTGKSVDFVTKAGRDGKIFTEAARGSSAATEGDDMDKAEVMALIKEAQAPLVAENKMLREMLSATRGKSLVEAELKDVRLPEAIKNKIVESIAPAVPTDANGAVDAAKLKTMIEASVKDWLLLLPSLGLEAPAAMGTRMTEAEVKADIKAFEGDRDGVREALADLFVGPKLAKGGNEEARQLRKAARKAFIEGRAA